MADDFGYFGKGAEGYAQYVAASGEDGSFKNSGGKGRKPGGNRPGGGGIGCLVAIAVIIILAVFKFILNAI